MYCPKCRDEYREGFTECADCKVPLVSELPPEPKPEPKPEPDLTWADLVCIRIYDNREEAEFARSFLETNGIDAEVFADDCGGWRPGLHSSEGLRLMVVKRDAEKALQLLNQIDEGE